VLDVRHLAALPASHPHRAGSRQAQARGAPGSGRKLPEPVPNRSMDRPGKSNVLAEGVFAVSDLLVIAAPAGMPKQA